MAVNVTALRKGLIAAILLSLVLLLYSKGKNPIHWNSIDPGESLPVLIADRYIPAYSIIKSHLVHVQDYPKEFIPPGALHTKADLQSENGQMLFTSAISIPEGQPLTRALLTDASQNDTLGSLIRPGKVAISFEIDKAHGVGGWIRPGDRVALFGPAPMERLSGRALGRKTRLLLPLVVVVAVDAQRLGQGKPGENTAEAAGPLELSPMNEAKIITVLVSPADAALLIEAREEGSLSVVLRSVGDDIPWPTTN